MQENSKCVCSVDTGCRLTSITIMYSGQEVEKKRKTNPKTDKQVEEKRKTNPKNDKQDTQTSHLSFFEKNQY